MGLPRSPLIFGVLLLGWTLGCASGGHAPPGAATPDESAGTFGSAVFSARDRSGLTWTPSVSGDSADKATISLWYEVRADTGDYQHLFSARAADAVQAQQIWIYEGRISVLTRVNTDNGMWVETLDTTWGEPGRWHHLLAHLDLTRPSATEAIALWLDGEKVPVRVQADHPHSTFQALFHAGATHHIGITGDTEPFDGRLRELHVLDGRLEPLGSFFARGASVPYRGSHGKNGFYLDFSDPNDLGDDRGGGNDFENHGVGHSPAR